MAKVRARYQNFEVGVIGLGYIGLPTAILLAEAGHTVFGYDIDVEVQRLLASGKTTQKEPGLAARLNGVLSNQKLVIVDSFPSCTHYIIAVPTPITSHNEPDLSYVYAAINDCIAMMRPGVAISVESTIAVGAIHDIAAYITTRTSLRVGIDFFLAYAPERVLPGLVFHELVENNRVIGGITQACSKKVEQLYATFVRGRLRSVSVSMAEMVKLVENSARDVSIAFAHQVAAMCHELDLSAESLISLANEHPRVAILQPTCGVGGHCIAIDPWFLIDRFPTQTQLLRAAREVNMARPRQVVAQILVAVESWRNAHGGGEVCVGILGLTYKPNVDDLRSSPALEVACALQKEEAHMRIRVCDPQLTPSQIAEYQLSPVTGVNDLIAEADILVALVAHDSFVESVKAHTQLLDFCGLRNKQAKLLKTSKQEVHEAAI